jgi:DNA-binding NarL/FixJ family response regulator
MTLTLDVAASLTSEAADSLCATSAENERTASRSGLSRARELTRLVEAVYVDSPDLERWARGLVGSMSAVFPRSSGIDLAVLENGSLTVATTRAPLQRLAAEAASAERVSSDPIQLVARVERNVSATLSVFFDRHGGPTSYDRALLARAALYLENGLRFRWSRGAIQRIVSEDCGSWFARPLAAGARPPAAGACNGERRELWDALTSGRATLAPLGAGRYAVIDAAEPTSHRSLSSVEHSIVTLAARGLPGKVLSYELRLAPATVSRHLGNAAAKLGLPSAFELVRVASHLATNRPPELESTELTAAERDVLTLVRAGLSNAAIARARMRSVHTVANQVASLLRKTRSSSRRTLVASVERGVVGVRETSSAPGPESVN